tara:strand:- start:65 stop:448 length:384 start_codon:yes stop_codon:yes gene_type:complete
MVGLLYLPRLFVYHNDTGKNSKVDKTFQLMEYRLLSYIMTPACLFTYFFGFILVYENLYFFQETYFLVKCFLVLVLTIFHFYLSILYKDFKKGYRKKKTKFYRLINEIPTIVMIAIVLLIVVKPNFH